MLVNTRWFALSLSRNRKSDRSIGLAHTCMTYTQTYEYIYATECGGNVGASEERRLRRRRRRRRRTYTYTHAHTHTHVCTRTHTYTRVHTQTHTHMYREAVAAYKAAPPITYLLTLRIYRCLMGARAAPVPSGSAAPSYIVMCSLSRALPALLPRSLSLSLPLSLSRRLLLPRLAPGQYSSALAAAAAGIKMNYLILNLVIFNGRRCRNYL